MTNGKERWGIRGWVIWAVLTALFFVIVTVLLLALVIIGFDSTATRASQVFDFARSAATLLGVPAVAGGAMVAYRRQKTLEEKRNAETESELRAKKNDLHKRWQETSAQLGSDEPVIRTAGVFAIEALAEEWTPLDIERRNQCIDLLCGYLRSAKGLQWDDENKVMTIEKPEEAVRNEVVNVIRRHLQNPEYSLSWSDHKFNFDDAYFADANFRDAHFVNPISFRNATFSGFTDFSEARFSGVATFSEARFAEFATFGEARFTGSVTFSRAEFTEFATFSRAEFTEFTDFTTAEFTGSADFTTAKFNGLAWFFNAKFTGSTWFCGAKFTGSTWFCDAKFTKDADFRWARFASYSGWNTSCPALPQNFESAAFDQDGEDHLFCLHMTGDEQACSLQLK